MVLISMLHRSPLTVTLKIRKELIDFPLSKVLHVRVPSAVKPGPGATNDFAGAGLSTLARCSTTPPPVAVARTKALTVALVINFILAQRHAASTSRDKMNEAL